VTGFVTTGSSIIPKGGNSCGPFHEVVHSDNNEFFSIKGSGVIGDEVDAPFSKGADGDNRVKRGRGFTHFLGKYLT